MQNLTAQALGLKSVGAVYHNLDYDQLFEHETSNSEGAVSENGTMMVDTGKFTGRSPKDKYFVHQKPSFENIAWGKINKEMAPEVFDELGFGLHLVSIDAELLDDDVLYAVFGALLRHGMGSGGW